MCRAEIVLPEISVASPRIKSVQWHRNGSPVSWPVTDLARHRPLYFSFDILSSDNDEEILPWLRAKIEHRSAEWEKENISDNEFLSGFNISDIGQGKPSIGGITTPYRHFELEVPPIDILPMISGNYLLKIYDDNNPDSILICAPFMIEEQSTHISGSVNVVTDIDFKKSHQQLELSIRPINIPSTVRPQELKVYTNQNNTPGTMRFLGFPSIVTPTDIKFNHKKELIYDAGNEYRRMEIIDINTPMLHVDHIEWYHPFYHQILSTDYQRKDKPYLMEYNNNGIFVIRDYNSDNSDIEADYCVVHFSLDGSEIPDNSNIFIEGDFTQRSLSPEYKMSWDKNNNIYYKSLLLKQGAYDYKYITPDSKNSIYEVEGNNFETANKYNVAVYYRVPGERFDRLAATTTLSL